MDKLHAYMDTVFTFPCEVMLGHAALQHVAMSQFPTHMIEDNVTRCIFNIRQKSYLIILSCYEVDMIPFNAAHSQDHEE